MKNKIILTAILITLFSVKCISQTVKGTIIYHDETMNGMEMPLIGTVVSWSGTNVGTAADEDGNFTIKQPDSSCKKLVISFVGYKTDTVIADFKKPMKIILEKSLTLKEVTVTDNNLSFVSTKPMNQLNIGSGELKLAACCNLGEAFQTTPQVDVSTTDAVSGARQIQLLGLSGNYTQILTENTPQLLGLSKPFGLDYLPGPWIESMQLTQGVGSVTNGYDGLNGAVNVEIKKPNSGEIFFINAYGNSFGRVELNADGAIKLNHSWSTILLVHADENNTKMDVNNDGFMDMPIGDQIHFSNRWLYTQNDTNGIQLRFGFDILNQNKTGGQMQFNPNDNPLTSNYYGISIKTNREAAYTKLGYISNSHPYESSGLILSGFNHQQDSYFGRTYWNADEQNFSAKYVYQTIINNTNNIVRFGASYLYDNEKENLSFLNGLTQINNPIYQSVPGAFTEYNYTGKHLSSVLGIRGDYHNEYGFIINLRGFIKYDFTKNTTLKLLAGSAFHQPDIISENVSLLASSRQWIIKEPLQAEKAINTGAAFQQTFHINNHDGDFIANAYHTWFNNQVIVDVNASSNEVEFYNLHGNSFADNLLLQIDYSLIKNLNLKLAYRYNNVKQQEENGLIEKTFVVQNKFYAGIDYTTKNKKWKWSGNWQYYGSQTLPNTQSNPEQYQIASTSPAYQLLNSQVTFIHKEFEIYIGAENILDQRQKQVIVDSKNPFGEYFDASMVWGPVMGRMFYGGIRFSIK
jgi:outer membrane receptor for ferrienterochelin and colicins